MEPSKISIHTQLNQIREKYAKQKTMAEEVVSFALETLASLIKDEVKLLANFSKELTNIRNELRSIQALLKDADKKGEMAEGEQVIKVWLKELRHVAFDIEDLLEEYVFRHHTQQPHVHGHGTCGFIYKIKYFFNKWIERRNMATRIEDIKVCLHRVSERKNEYNLVDLNQVSTTAAAYFVRDPRVDALFLDEAKVVGIDEPREKLVRWLVGEPNSSIGVVSVHGQGGLGKTTLVKKVQENAKVKAHFPICAWIRVSETVDIKRLLKELILQTIKDKEEKKELLPELDSMDVKQLKAMLHDRFQGQRYVVVMDDVWDLGAWTDIKSVLPDVKNGSRILVTTRKQDIATVCKENSGYAYELKPLTPENSWMLFCKVASNIDDFAPQHLREVSRKFLKKCGGGVPLAIVAVAGFLSAKETNAWEEIYSDNESLLSHSQLNDVNIILSLSYNDLPYHLKSCLLYLCIFPEDHVIKCSKLVHLWAAEGFFDPRTSFGMSITKEDVAKRYLDELIVRSLVQVQDIDGSGRVKTCRIHDLLRDFLLTKARDQDFAEFFTEWPPHMKPDTYRVRRLSFNMKDVEERNLPNSASFFSEIKSLFAFQRKSLFNSSVISTFLLPRIKLLKVLDLGETLLEEIPEEIFSNTFFLRYLSLFSRRRYLSGAVGKLKNLETLKLRFSENSGFELPVEILELKHLRNLLGRQLALPKGIGGLTALEKLRSVDGSKGGIDVFQELGMLTRLRSLSISSISAEVASHLFAVVEKMESLHSLNLKTDEFVGNIRCLPPQLQRLTLKGKMDGSRPDWICSMNRLTKLYLFDSRIDDYSFFEHLQLLPYLMELVIEIQAIRATELSFNVRSFSKLRTLQISSLFFLKLIRIEEGAMPCIQFLKFELCEELDSAPIGIEHLTTLKQIDIMDMPAKFEDQMTSQCWKDGHFPSINITRYEWR